MIVQNKKTNIYNCRQNKSLFFGTIPPNLITAEKAVKKIKNMGIISDTMIDFRYHNLPERLQTPDRISRFKAFNRKICKKIFNMRMKSVHYTNYSEFITGITTLINRDKVGNCGENASLLQAELLAKGIKADKVRLDVLNKKNGGNRS